MNATTVAVDLAKNVYQLAVADENWRVIEKHRLTRAQFERFFANRAVGHVIMEACGSAHYWARQIQTLGIVSPQVDLRDCCWLHLGLSLPQRTLAEGTPLRLEVCRSTERL